MSADTSTSTHGVLNGLSDHYARILGPKYSDLYRKHIAGHRLAHDMTIQEYRDNPVILSFGTAAGPEVQDVKEVKIPVEGAEILALVYIPPGAPAGPLPCYINYHGGGWVIGDVRDDDAFNRSVARETQSVVIDVGYRLSPEHRFPIPVFDSWQAYQYIATHAWEFGIDPNRLAVGGFSAGGHLAAVISQLARDKEFQYKPCFQLLVIPVCDATVLTPDVQLADSCQHLSWRENYDAPFLSFARMSWFYKYFFPDNATEETLRDPLMSPLMAESLADLPPALIVPAEVDVLRDEGIAYATRLAKESDSWTQLWLAKRVPHPFPHQTEATELAVEFRRLAIQRLGEAFTGTLPPKEQSLSNVV